MNTKVSDVSKLIINVLLKNKSLGLRDILLEVQKINKDILYTDIEKSIRNKKISLFKRLGHGIYTLSDPIYAKSLCDIEDKHIIKRIPIDGLGVSNNYPIIHKESEEKTLDIQKHMGFLKKIASRAAKTFKLDIEDIFSETITIAYEYKDKYDPKKGTPTTFLNSQVTTRLYNKIKRELIPNYFKVVHDEDGTKEGVRFLVSQQSLDAPFNNNKGNMDKDTYLIDCISKSNIENNFDDSDTDYLAVNNDIKEKIIKCLKEDSGLKYNEFIVIEKRFGLDGNGSKTLEQVGDEVNLTKERVRQVINKVFKNLKCNDTLKCIYGIVD